MKKMSEPIDFVVTWVDGGDPAWQAQKRQYTGEGSSSDASKMEIDGEDSRDERYRDWDLMRYWFRGVEKYAPWVRKIHFVTWGHLPPWLDTTHPKLHIVRHEDYIPEEYLPTFNCNALEIFLHRIEGLSEHFVYFNDDIFCVRPLKPEDFFVEGKPCDMLAFQPVVANPSNPIMSYLYLNNTLVLSKHFDKRENVKKQPGKYFKIGYPPLYFFYNMLEVMFPQFTGFYSVHGPYSFRKNLLQTIWDSEEDILKKTASHRFRSKEDISIHLFREWQKLNGDFQPKNVHRDLKYIEVGRNDKQLRDCLQKRSHKIVCVNDGNVPVDFESTQKSIQQAFGLILSNKSSYEK